MENFHLLFAIENNYFKVVKLLMKYANDNKIPLEINERDENGNIVIFRIL